MLSRMDYGSLAPYRIETSRSLRLSPNGGFIIVDLDVDLVGTTAHRTILDVVLCRPCRKIDGDYDLLAT